MKIDRESTINWILIITVLTLAFICSAVVMVMLAGFFFDNINNDQIFEIIGPAFSTVIGAFVGLIGGISLQSGVKNSDKD